MLTDEQRSILASQPIRARQGLRGWVYLRGRVRAEEYHALLALAKKAETYPCCGRHPYQIQITTLIRAIASGFIGLVNMRTGQSFAAPERQLTGKIRHRRIIPRLSSGEWPEGLNTED